MVSLTISGEVRARWSGAMADSFEVFTSVRYAYVPVQVGWMKWDMALLSLPFSSASFDNSRYMLARVAELTPSAPIIISALATVPSAKDKSTSLVFSFVVY